MSKPKTKKQIKAWLRDSDKGRSILEDLFKEVLEGKCRCCVQMRPAPRVLIVLRRLGDFPGVEVYADKGIMSHIMELPDLPDDGRFGPLLEEWIYVHAPKNFRRLTGIWAGRVKRDVFRGLPIEEVARNSELLDCIREVRSCQGKGRGKRITST